MNVTPTSPLDADQVEEERDPEVEQSVSTVAGAVAASSNLILHHSDDPLSTNTHAPTTTRPQWWWKVWYRIIIQKYHVWILVVMVLFLWPAGWKSYHQVLTKTDSSFHNPPMQSPSYLAQQAFSRTFPSINTSSSNADTFLLVLESKDNTSLAIKNDTHNRSSTTASALAAQTFALKLQQMLQDNLHQQQQQQKELTASSNHNTSLVEVSSYYQYQANQLKLLSQAYLSQDEHMTLIEVVLATTHKAIVNRVIQVLDDTITKLQQDEPNLEVGCTGLPYFALDLRSSTQADLKRMHTWVLPLALVLLAYTLLRRIPVSQPRLCCCCCLTGHQRLQMLCLILLPICGMISTVALWSVVLNVAVIPYLQVTQFTPSIMMSLTLAMGLDYTLFLVARYLTATTTCDDISDEQVTIPHSNSTTLTTRNDDSPAVQIMLEQAGPVVVVSGMTLLCTFLGLVALPLPMLQSIGVGASITIGSAMLMNLLVIPSLLSIPWLERCLRPLVVDSEEETAGSGSIRLSPEAIEGSEYEELRQALLSESRRQEAEEASNDDTQNVDSMWIRLARHVLHPYKSIIIVLIILQFLLVPVAWQARRLEASDLSFTSLLPQHHSPSLETYEHLIHTPGFGPGKLAPFRILVDGNPSHTLMNSSTGFDLQHDLVATLRNHSTTTTTASYGGISVAKTTPIPYSIYQASETCAVANCTNDALRCLHVLTKRLLSENGYSTIIMVELVNASPFDHDGMQWLESTRHTLNEWMQSHPGVDVYMDGMAAVAHDAVDAVYGSFPRVVGTTLAIVFGLLGLVFRSIVPPLRSILSIGFTLTVSFGMGVLIYQDGFLSSLHLRSLTAVHPELSWLVPVMSFSIMVGLALDYDVFLFLRIFEFRFQEGYGHESSIAAGLEETGGIITSAGMIMALSFGSLLASQSPALDQWAFLVTFSVLLDTFIVRTVLVPAMTAWVGEKYSWYPRKMPTTTTTLYGFDEPVS